MKSTTFILLIAICFALFVVNGVNADFLLRTIPTNKEELKTHFDGIYTCNDHCGKGDIITFKFISASTDVASYLTPSKVEIEFFTTLDKPMGKFSANFNKDLSASITINYKTTTEHGENLRFAAQISYKTISPQISQLLQPKLLLSYSEGAKTFTSSASLYFVEPLRSEFVVDLVYEQVVSHTYTLLAVAKDLKFETNHIFIRPFGALRNKIDPAQKIECTVNSLPFKTVPLKDELGDYYYELSLTHRYRSTYHFPRHIDVSFSCTFGLEIHNPDAPFGIAFSFVPRATTDLNMVPTKFITSKDAKLIHWHADFLSDFKILLPYEQYQSSYLPYHLDKNDKVTTTGTEIAPQSQTDPVITVASNADGKTVYRSHYTYHYAVYGSHISFNPAHEWFELKVQNTHQASHVATQWSASLEQWNRGGGKTQDEHRILARGNAKVKENNGNTITYDLIKPNIPTSVDQLYQFPFSLFTVDIELEFDKLPALTHFFPASVSLTLNKKVKKYPDQPLSLWQVAVIGSYPYSNTWVESGELFTVIPTPSKQFKFPNHRTYSFVATFTPNQVSEELSLSLPTQHYLFQGDFSTCTINDKAVPGLNPWGEEFTGYNFLVRFENVQTVIIKDAVNTIKCPSGYLITAQKTNEADFFNDHIPMTLIGERIDHDDVVDSLYAHTDIKFTDHLVAHHTARTFFVVVFFLVIIGLIVYLIAFKRDKIYEKFLKVSGSSKSSSTSTSSPRTSGDDQLPHTESLNGPDGGYQAPQL
jgi:hypothetical protein